MIGRPTSLVREGDRGVMTGDRISNGGPLLDAWQYVVRLVPAGAAGRDS
jgi:hypothetical protein